MSYFRTSASCGPNGCVEVALTVDGVRVRDSKNPHGPVLLFRRDEWVAFLEGARRGQFDLP